jgi:hypothetical protein
MNYFENSATTDKNILISNKIVSPFEEIDFNSDKHTKVLHLLNINPYLITLR